MSDEGDRSVVHVVAAAILDASGCVLLSKRPPGKHLAGEWEFPGGKVESGETRLEGLTRELAEEIGIMLVSAHPLIRIRHAYRQRIVDLDVWKVTAYNAQALGLEGQLIQWCPRDELPAARLVAADQPIVTTLLLPEKITSVEGQNFTVDSPAAAGRLTGRMCSDQTQAVAAAAAGADFLLATSILDPPAIEAFTADLNVPVYVRDVELEVAWKFGASGLHTLGGR